MENIGEILGEENWKRKKLNISVTSLKKIQKRKQGPMAQV